MTPQNEKDAYCELFKLQREVCEHNNIILSEYKVYEDDFSNLLEDCNITGKIEIVREPDGNEQIEKEEYGNLTITHIDQWSIGIEGDSYAGFIYAKIKSIELWLKIPYSC
jgi:hypothetical protein